MEDAGKKAYIGMGFAERSDSFDFSEHEVVACEHQGTKLNNTFKDVAIQDYTKCLLSPILFP